MQPITLNQYKTELVNQAIKDGRGSRAELRKLDVHQLDKLLQGEQVQTVENSHNLSDKAQTYYAHAINEYNTAADHAKVHRRDTVKANLDSCWYDQHGSEGKHMKSAAIAFLKETN